ncbi:MAG: hypothetical protein QG594_1254 [Bacteroidota bacterium]|jgi:hypothetical protein|nr:hypothetical protein [Bacteroidota bacterium]
MENKPVIRKMFHAQEKREKKLFEPIKCIKDDAWLGEGWYFWHDILDADKWGSDFKNKRKFYEIYSADIDCSRVLDTVFNEVSYNFWIRQIEKIALKFIKETNEKPTKKELHNYFKEKGVWDSFDGILFQDVPKNNDLVNVKEFFYRKRIQLVVYNKKIISNFAFESEQKCA